MWWVVGSILHGILIELFLVGMCYPVCGMVHIKPLLLTWKTSACSGGRGFLLSHWSLMVDLLCYFSFQPMQHDWINKGHGMCYPVYRMVHIKDPLLLMKKGSPCSGGSRFPLLLSKWSCTICHIILNKMFFLSFLSKWSFTILLYMCWVHRKILYFLPLLLSQSNGLLN